MQEPIMQVLETQKKKKTRESMTEETKTAWVYMVRCCDNSLYTGATTDLERRVEEHNSSSSRTKYTRSRQPVELVWAMTCPNMSFALSFEAFLKTLSKAEKEAVIVMTKESKG